MRANAFVIGVVIAAGCHRTAAPTRLPGAAGAHVEALETVATLFDRERGDCAKLARAVASVTVPSADSAIQLEIARDSELEQRSLVALDAIATGYMACRHDATFVAALDRKFPR